MKLIKIIGFSLLAASLLYLHRAFFEFYYLTPLRGPQNVFFSLVHLWPKWLLNLFFASGIAYFAYLIFAAVVSILGFLERFAGHVRYLNFVRVSFLILGVHLILELTYMKWAYALFSK